MYYNRLLIEQQLVKTFSVVRSGILKLLDRQITFRQGLRDTAVVKSHDRKIERIYTHEELKCGWKIKLRKMNNEEVQPLKNFNQWPFYCPATVIDANYSNLPEANAAPTQNTRGVETNGEEASIDINEVRPKVHQI